MSSLIETRARHSLNMIKMIKMKMIKMKMIKMISIDQVDKILVVGWKMNDSPHTELAEAQKVGDL